MSIVFGAARQVGFLVSNLDEAVEHWSRALGVGPFLMLRHLQFSKFRYLGKTTAPPDVSMAFAYTGPMQIELIEQHDDTPSVYHFHKEGPAFQMHHLASWLTKSDFDLKMADCERRGLEIVQQGVLAGSGARFTYFGSLDRQEKLLFEITDIDQPGPMMRMNRIQSAAENWDGRDIILKPQS